MIQTLAILIWTTSGLKIISTILEALGRLTERVTWLESRTVPPFDNLAKLIVVGGALCALRHPADRHHSLRW